MAAVVIKPVSLGILVSKSLAFALSLAFVTKSLVSNICF